jgi:hypothetical protein
MTGEFRSSNFVDFDTGEVFLPPMRLLQQKPTPWSIGDKIEIFECRVEVWQLGVAAQMLKAMEAPQRSGIWLHAAYGLVALTFSYFEMIGKTLNPSSKKRGTASPDFKAGLCDVYPQLRTASGTYSPEVSEFLDRIRNGVYHLAYTKKGLVVHHNNSISTKDFDSKLASELPEEACISGNERVYLMDPHRVTRSIIQHFATFISRLKQPGSQAAGLQAKFEEFFDEFHEPGP